MPSRPDAPATNIGNFTIKYHRVKLDIDNQVLRCSVDQVFHNETDMQLEGIYLFPAPVGAVVSGFSMEVDGKPLEGRLLSREEARSIYEGIVSKRRDPGGGVAPEEEARLAGFGGCRPSPVFKHHFRGSGKSTLSERRWRDKLECKNASGRVPEE